MHVRMYIYIYIMINFYGATAFVCVFIFYPIFSIYSLMLSNLFIQGELIFIKIYVEMKSFFFFFILKNNFN